MFISLSSANGIPCTLRPFQSCLLVFAAKRLQFRSHLPLLGAEVLLLTGLSQFVKTKQGEVEGKNDTSPDEEMSLPKGCASQLHKCSLCSAELVHQLGQRS